MRLFRFIAAIVAVGLLFGLAGALFQSGYLAGAAAGGGAGVPVAGYWWGFFPFGVFGGFFHLLGLIIIVFLVIGLFRAALFGGTHAGRGHWGHGPRGSWGGRWDPERTAPFMDRAREVHDEWHRRQTDSAGGGTDKPETGTV